MTWCLDGRCENRIYFRGIGFFCLHPVHRSGKFFTCKRSAKFSRETSVEKRSRILPASFSCATMCDIQQNKGRRITICWLLTNIKKKQKNQKRQKTLWNLVPNKFAAFYWNKTIFRVIKHFLQFGTKKLISIADGSQLRFKFFRAKKCRKERSPCLINFVRRSEQPPTIIADKSWSRDLTLSRLVDVNYDLIFSRLPWRN